MPNSVLFETFGRRTFLLSLSGTVLAASGCGFNGTKFESADIVALRSVYLDKLEILAGIATVSNQRPDLSAVLTTTAEQSKAHLDALLELMDGAALPTSSPGSALATQLSQLLSAKAAEHAKLAADISDPEKARIVIQICSSELVQASQLVGLAI